MVQLPLLEYNLTHPHPKNRIFRFITYLLFLLVLPTLIIVNLVTLGLELVPSLQPTNKLYDTFLENWWGTRYLPALLRPTPPPCQPRDIGRGDTFRLSASLFDYTVMSAWDISKGNESLGVQEQKRFEYRDQSFAHCYVNRAGYSYKTADLIHSVFFGIFCPGSEDYPITVSMKTQMTFSVLPSQDFTEEYYGPGLGLLNLTTDDNSSDYRKLVLVGMELISSDAIAIMRKSHLSSPYLNLMIDLEINPTTGEWRDIASVLTYLNGTQPDMYPEEARIYIPTISNLISVTRDAVNLDLGNHRSNIFTNATRLSRPSIMVPNRAPNDTDPANWAAGAFSRNYGYIPAPYQTWAEMILNGLPINISTATGMPDESVMVTNYLCPVYQVKRTSSLLASLFVGTATMIIAVWGAWMFLTTIVAMRIEKPQVQCLCKDCKKREAEEQKQEKNEEATPAKAGASVWRMSFLGVIRRAKLGHHSTDEENGKPDCETPGHERLTYMSDTKRTSELGGITTEEK